MRPSPAIVASVEEEPVDGRHARRQRNRDAVVRALLDLYGAGNLDPSSEEIAERAGLSPRSLFRYFDDVDDLVRAAINHQHERVDPLARLDVPAGASLAERVTALVQARMRLYDAIGAVGRVSRLRAPFQPLVQAELSQARTLLRRQVRSVFAPELAAMGPARSASALAAVDVLCSFEAHELLRNDQGLSRARTVTALTDSLTRLLSLEDR